MKSYLQGLITGGALIPCFYCIDRTKNMDIKIITGHHDIDDIMHKLEDLEDKLKKN
ncbi:MAG: hypothetical protein ACJZ10_05605 [Candidatus Neomarinimicrobiota bacterium]